MQIHEITLREAGLEPLDPKKIMATARPTKFNYGTPPESPRVGNEPQIDPAAFKAKQDELATKQAQYQAQADQGAAQSRARTQAASATKTTTAKPGAQPTAGAGAFSQMAQQVAQQTPAGPTRSSTQGIVTPTATGLVHTASERNPNPRTEPMSAQQKWDIEFRKLQNQFPGRTPQQYQRAMLQRTGTARPGGEVTTVQQVQTPQTVQTVQTTAPRVTPSPRAAQVTPAAPAQYPPITLGSGPKAQVYVNKGRGYVDSKTGKPMPPSIVKAMGIQ